MITPPLRRRAALPVLVLSAALLPTMAAAQEVTVSDYARAEQFLSWNVSDLVSGDQVTPRFFDGDRFWFRSNTSTGH
ncbi:MAG TPA: hypothetical protein VJ925_03905, partial [Longimicrobiales bacterium]|nr:hypothetical protein [Longimicrobiales bacterium]